VINRKFHFGLRKLRLPDGGVVTVKLIAERIYASRSHVTRVINNELPGGHTRPKVKRWLEEQFPEHAPQLIEALGWNNVPRGT
jgi:hypothetical protein